MNALMQMDINVGDGVTPVLSRLAGLADAEQIHSYIAPQVEELTRLYLNAIAPGRHSTAERLGADPTGHLGRAASAVESGHDDEAAYITIPRIYGLGRAFQDYVITPKNGKKWLTIPATASAYGKRAGEFSDLKFVPFTDDLAALMARSKSDGKYIVVFWLKKEVTIEQDRTLLPDDQAFGEAAARGVDFYIEDVEGKGGKA